MDAGRCKRRLLHFAQLLRAHGGRRRGCRHAVPPVGAPDAARARGHARIARASAATPTSSGAGGLLQLSSSPRTGRAPYRLLPGLRRAAAGGVGRHGPWPGGGRYFDFRLPTGWTVLHLPSTRGCAGHSIHIPRSRLNNNRSIEHERASVSAKPTALLHRLVGLDADAALRRIHDLGCPCDCSNGPASPLSGWWWIGWWTAMAVSSLPLLRSTSQAAPTRRHRLALRSGLPQCREEAPDRLPCHFPQATPAADSQRPTVRPLAERPPPSIHGSTKCLTRTPPFPRAATTTLRTRGARRRRCRRALAHRRGGRGFPHAAAAEQR